MPRRSEQPNPALEYAEQVVAGKIVTGRPVRLACERHLRDLEDGHRRGLRFDVAAGNRAIKFFDALHHHRGRWAKAPCTCWGDDADPLNCPRTIKLELWQKFIVACEFGWQRRHGDRWLRRFNLSLLLVARKNAKTTLAAGEGLYMGFFDGEPGAEVYAAATKRDQARYCQTSAKAFVKASPYLAARIHGASQKAALYDDHLGSFDAVSSDSNTLDALAPHCAIIDEYHAHPDASILETLRTGMGSRDQPLAKVTSTAGLRVEGSPCKSLRDYSVKVLEGVLPEDDGLFAYIAELDPDDDWREPAVWIKANPNLGVSVDPDQLAAEAERAAEDPERLVHFQTKRLNMWVGAALVWIPHHAWRACPDRLPADDYLVGRKCWGGLDLAATQDMNAFGLVFPPDEHGAGIKCPHGAEWKRCALCNTWTAKLWYWIPKVRYDSRAKGDAPIKAWADAGWIDVTDGNETDYGRIRQTVADQAEVYRIAAVGFDPWNASQLAQDLDGDGLLMVKVPQTFKALSVAIKRFKALAMGARFNHLGNPVLAWNVSNVAIREDPNENQAFDKRKSTERIDGATATGTAMSLAIDNAGQEEITVDWYVG